MPARKPASQRSPEYNKYHASPKAKAARAARNAARQRAEREGRVKKGDGKVVHHDVKTRKGGASAGEIRRARTRVIPKGENTRKSNRQR